MLYLQNVSTDQKSSGILDFGRGFALFATHLTCLSRSSDAAYCDFPDGHRHLARRSIGNWIWRSACFKVNKRKERLIIENHSAALCNLYYSYLQLFLLQSSPETHMHQYLCSFRHYRVRASLSQNHPKQCSGTFLANKKQLS